jgi:hypothetical protein
VPSLWHGVWVRALLFLAAIAAFGNPVAAQSLPPPPEGVFENVTIGEPMAKLRPVLGDPVRVIAFNDTIIWRYLSHGNTVYIDVLVKNNLAESVTVVSHTAGVSYADARGMTFGMTPEEVRTRLGPATKESTNSDDGSLDLWYLAKPYGWIYEFHSGKLDFIQLIAAASLFRTFAPGPAAAPNDGISIERAVAIRPSNSLSNAAWIAQFLAHNACGNDGSWAQTSTRFAQDSTNHDALAYTIVHAKCSDGSLERDFFFDTPGVAGSPSPSPSPH